MTAREWLVEHICALSDEALARRIYNSFAMTIPLGAPFCDGSIEDGRVICRCSRVRRCESCIVQWLEGKIETKRPRLKRRKK